jgi:poly(3-hydroxybutyrate) depolymerase
MLINLSIMKIAKTIKTLCLIYLSFHISHFTFSQKLNSGPQVLSFHSDVDDTEQPYAIYIPKEFSEKKSYPLVVMLHGAGSNHRLALRRVFGKSNADGENDVEASLVFPKWKNVEYIVASVYARGTMGYQGIAEKDVMDMLNDVKKRFNIDENRTYLTGLSMGGGGTMWIGLTRPDIWAAIAPVCPAPPIETISYLENAFNMPVHFFQGGDDPVVKPENTRKWVEDFKKAGAKVTYQEYPGVKHDSWVNAYKDEFIFSWFDKIERNPYPNRIKFTTTQLKYSKAYWIDIEEMLIGEQAKIEANFKNKNMLDIQTSNVSSFSLNIMEHPNFNAKKQLMLNIDGQNIPVFGLADKQVLKKINNKWVVGKHEFDAKVKNKSTEGPMTEIIGDRHIYVYGTDGNPSKEELLKRKLIAEQAADWSYYRGDFMGRVMVFPRVLSDKEVRPNDIERSHLVLFGTKNTNSMIAKYATNFPFELKEESANSSNLTFIYPNGKKYILVSSGIPFWEVPPFDNGPFGRLRTSGKAGILTGYGDWVYYDKDLNNVISTARFDNNWKIPENEANKLKNIIKIKVN